MNNIQLAFAMLVDPRAAFLSLRDKPNFWFPLLLIAIGTAASLVWYFNVVDFAWLTDQLQNADPRAAEMSAEKRAESAAGMSKDVMMWMSLTFMLIGLPMARIAESIYYSFAARLTNFTQSFRHWLALACWSSLPLALAIVLAAIFLVMHPSGQVTQEQLNVLSLNELFFDLRPDEPGYTLLSTLTVLHPWAWWLAAYGIRVWSGRSWAFSLGLSLLPWVLFYGIWALVSLAT